MSLNQYLKAIQKNLSAGDSTEHTHRPALKIFIESLDKEITATNEPKRQTFGAPDYVIRKREIPLGYIEAKDVGKNLAKLSKTDKEQLERYLDSLNNLVLTNYLEFRWYVRGKLRMTSKLAEVDKSGKLKINFEGEKETEELINAFLTEQVETIASPQELAKRMAAIARLIHITIEKALKEDSKGIENTLHEQLESFRLALLPNLEEDEFADLYAQTIAYGLFTARCNHTESNFTRREAAHYLPKTNPFLRETFDRIAGINLDERIAWAVDDLAELLNRAKMGEILQDFGKRTRQEDPVVHFYETFLKAYDPKLRETRGVYYTPEPVVSYIVRSVDKILQEDFGLLQGLADSSKIKVVSADGENESHKVLILDPATGTGTFLYSVIKNIFARFEKNRGMWDGYVSKHLLPRIFGFEVLVAPYAVAHLKLGLLLDETGYKFQANERLRVYLTNTLEEPHSLKEVDPTSLTHYLNVEAHSAKEVKQEKPVMVVVGNPPYSGHSANTGRWITGLLHGRHMIDKLMKGVDIEQQKKVEQIIGNYFEVDGKPLGEKNPKWLNDDYVKFIRFAQWRIEQTGYGVLAFITNHGYLNNPTFRGMRQALMKTFDDIYVLDLHGNTKKKERSPDDSKDENVFDIQQGVCIGIFVKKQSHKTEQPKVFHAHLYGVREIFVEKANNEKELAGGKYQWLWQNDIRSTKWEELTPQSPFYLFVPQNINLLAEYEKGWKITEAMPVNVLGFQTHRDHFAIAFDKKELEKRIEDLRETTLTDNEIRNIYKVKDNRDWQLATARKWLRKNKDWKKDLIRCSYRPFDNRFCYFSTVAMDYPRRELLDHVTKKENLCLLSSRQQATTGYKHCWVAKEPANDCVVSTTSREANQVFPLYLYPTERESLFDGNFSGGRRPNLSPEFVAELSKHLNLEFIADGKGDLKRTFGPEDILAYAYAVLNSPTYRKRYAEFLKIDFPRLPITSNTKLFSALVSLGAELVMLHLMETRLDAIVTFPEKGDNIIEFVKYEDGMVWINKKQFFAQVSQEVWDFHIGGYQVCQKWLKDRKGRKLTYDDLIHYQQIVSTLSETIRLMLRVDLMIDQHGGFPLK
ncbi:MAG TPA: type ISP restriction/modification enzyme [Pyrinomonadaceae bacterium]|jgi:predicted helicase